MAKKRQICIVTGTRAEFGLLRSLLDAIKQRNDLDIDLVVTGMHLLESFGYTIDDIRANGYRIAKTISMYSGRDRRTDYSAALATLIDQLGPWLIRRKTDILVVLGDRTEIFGAASAALMAGVPIAHIHGGEIAPGDLDDRIRFAVTSLADIHFPSTTDAQRRLIRFGQPPETVFRVGAIGMDEIFAVRRNLTAIDKKTIRGGFNLATDGPMLMIVCHPCGYGTEGEKKRMTDILHSLRRYQGVIIGPNSDPGHSGISRAIRQFITEKRNRQRWRFFSNLSRQDYLRTLWASDVLVGNSSSGIIEANALGTAVVNIGPRQQGRQRNGNAVFDCDYRPVNVIRNVKTALAKAATRKVKPSKAFGDGKTGHRIAEILANLAIDPADRVKRLAY